MDKRKFNESEKKRSVPMPKAMAPSSALGKDMCFAFLSGGLICVIGQAVGDMEKKLGVNEENVKSVILPR